MCLALGNDDALDTREGEDVVLKCRFSDQHTTSEFSYYWARRTTGGNSYDNVAIGDDPLSANYR